MAYAFDRIDGLIKKREKEEADTLNRSFAPSPTPQAPRAESAPLGAPLVSSSVDASSPPPRNRPKPFSRQAAGRAAMKAHEGQGKIPGFIGSIRGDIASRRAEVAAAAKKFAEEEKKKTGSAYAFTPGEIRTALTTSAGSPQAFKKLRSILSRETGRNIEPPELPSSSIPRAHYLSTPAGIKELYSKKRTPTYTPGMAAFDLGVLQSNPNFSAQLGSLRRDQAALRGESEKLIADKMEAIRAGDKKALDAAKAEITKYLEDNKATLTAEKAAQAEQLKEQLESIYAGTHERLGQLAGESDRAIRNMIAELQHKGLSEEEAELLISDIDPKRLKNIITSGISLPYARGREFDPRNLYTSEEAHKFNQIMGLLGRGETRGEGNVEKDLSAYLKRPEGFDKEKFHEIAGKRALELSKEAGEAKSALAPVSGSIDPRMWGGPAGRTENIRGITSSLDRAKAEGVDYRRQIRDALVKEYQRRIRAIMSSPDPRHDPMVRSISTAYEAFPELRGHRWDRMPKVLAALPDNKLDALIGRIMINVAHNPADPNRKVIGDMMRTELARNPFDKDEMRTFNVYANELGLPTLNENRDVHGSSMIFENKDDVNSGVNNVKAISNVLGRYLFGNTLAPY